MSKHTAGPWVIKRLGSSRRETVRIVEQKNHRGIADIKDASWESEDFANARLIVASPDMLEALECTLEYVEGQGLSANGVKMMIQYVINKAKGNG